MVFGGRIVETVISDSLLDGFLLGDIKVEPSLGQITHPSGEVVKLPRKPMDVLTCLCGAQGKPVTKDTLLETVWGNGQGADDNLKRCIYMVRDALKDKGKTPRVIRTVHRRGYVCLQPAIGLDGNAINAPISPANPVMKTTSVSARSIELPGFRGRAAIAVLPIRLQGTQEGYEYLSEALTEDIVSHLQRFRSFPIISHHSTMLYANRTTPMPQIAEELGVGYIVSGTLRRVGDDVDIRIQLTETARQTALWSQHYARQFSEIIQLQSDITLDIVGQLEPEIERVERELPLPEDETQIEAWHLVRRGSWHLYRLTKKDAVLAKTYLERATAMDPNALEAHVQLAWCYWWAIAAKRGTGSDWDPVQQCTTRALVLDPQNPRALLMQGILRLMHGDPEDAGRYFRESIDQNPSFGWAHSHLGSSQYLCGRPEEALISLRVGMRLSPFDLHMFHAYGDLATCNYMLGRWPESIEAATLSLRMRPGYWLPMIIRICSLARSGDIQTAQNTLQEFEERRGRITRKDIDWIRFKDNSWNNHMEQSLMMAGWLDPERETQ